MNFDKVKEIFADVRGTAFIGIDTLSNVALKGGKKNPLQGRVQKKVEGSNVMIAFGDGSVYENLVKRRMIAEGKDPETFVLKSRAWGKRIDGTPFIEHKDKHYLECIFKHAGNVTYLVDGVETPAEEIECLDLRSDEPEEKETDEGQGGIENKIIIRTYSLDSIQHIRFKGEH